MVLHKNFIYLALLAVLLQTIESAQAQSIAFVEEKYETELTKHVTMHQKYPSSGVLYGIDGDAIVRLQIDISGNILSYLLVKSTGNAILDKAVSDMIARANPVPDPPVEYFEDGDIAEFMLPIAFRSKKDSHDLQEIDMLFQQKVREAWE